MENPTTKLSPTYAFIDGQNLHKSIEEQGWKLGHKKFRIYLKDKLKVQKAFYFVGYMRENVRLYRNLEKSGYTLIYKKILRINPEKTKGNVDAELILNSMIHYHNFGEAVIVAGDGDHYCLIEYLNKTNKLKSVIIVGYMRENTGLYKKLEESDCTLIYKKIVRISPSKTKGNVDAELILNAMIHYHNFGQAVIVAGDGDYYCLIEYLNKTNKLKSIVIPNKQKYSSLLKKFGNKRLFVSDERKKLEYLPQKKRAAEVQDKTYT